MILNAIQINVSYKSNKRVLKIICYFCGCTFYHMLSIQAKNWFTNQKIHIQHFTGPPIVTLSQVSETVYEKPVEFKAAIRIFPKQCDVNWLRGSQQIDINQPKYAGSTVVGASPVLWINEVNKDDEGDYSIEVINKEWEPIRISKKLVVNTGKNTLHNIDFFERIFR